MKKTDRIAMLETNIAAMTPEAQATARQTLAKLKGNAPEVTEDPNDPEGMNDDRAEWAASALKAFRKITRTDPEDALKDLLCDLAHWCDREGISFDAELERAIWSYEEEAPNGKQLDHIEIYGAVAGPGLLECDCADRSWYGAQHDTACPLAGLDRNEPEPRVARDKPVVDWHIDEAEYIGDEFDGVYFQVAEGPDGWYMTAVVDSDTGHVVQDIVVDDGPYETRKVARTAGKNAAHIWCADNEVFPVIEMEERGGK